MALASYAVDFVVEVNSKGKQKKITEQLIKIRLRGERIQKDGEKKFIPKYLQWLSENILTDYSVDDLLYVLYDEMKDFLHNGKRIPAKKILEQRKKAFILWSNSRGERIVLSGKEAQQYINEKGYLTQHKLVEVDNVKGVSAFAGKVTGKVRLIMNTKDIVKFKKGEIIVSQMTDPHYLPIMKKAAAFVTDEGGMLCHAAIVARELQKPCVIGTKIATKIFKDGDLVEVDAIKGLVQKIIQ